MRSRGVLPSGRAWGVYEVLGIRVRVCDSFATAQAIWEAMHDGLLGDEEKSSVIHALLWADPDAVAGAYGPRLGDAMLDAMRQAFGMGGDSSGERVIDMDEDEARIRATCLEAYGRTYEELVETCSYRDFATLLAEAPSDTPMGRALYYRTAKPPDFGKGKQASRRRQEWQRAREAYALGHKASGLSGDGGKAANDKANDMFARMRRAAERG